MAMIELGVSEYQDKVYGAWLGKNIGGTLGAPYEGKKYVNSLEYYAPIPQGASPNDDLDFQLVWLQMLEEKGISPSLVHFAEYWMRHLSAYPFNEYGFCLRNLERGLRPPISGSFENYYVDEMGSPIRSEIWACVAPGDPQFAAAMAWKDAVLDHAGGEGVYGEMFWAAVESAAFLLSDPEKLIRIGLRMIPPGSTISRAVREAVWSWKNGISWAEARERVVTWFGHHSPCSAPQNHAFIILGWLYGKDFGDRLCKAVNCGYDTDCTGATLGALLGIIGGAAAIPEKWKKPIGEEIILHKFTKGIKAPKTVEELTKRTLAIAKKFVEERSDSVTFAEKTHLPNDLLSLLSRNEKAKTALRQDVLAAVAQDGDLEITLHYHGEPVLQPGTKRTIGISLQKAGEPVQGEVKLNLPQGWQVTPAADMFGQKRFIIFAAKVPGRNTVEVEVTLPEGARRAKFVILGPDEAKGFPGGGKVPRCPKCRARLEACICQSND